LAIIKKL